MKHSAQGAERSVELEYQIWQDHAGGGDVGQQD